MKLAMRGKYLHMRLVVASYDKKLAVYEACCVPTVNF